MVLHFIFDFFNVVNIMIYDCIYVWRIFSTSNLIVYEIELLLNLKLYYFVRESKFSTTCML